MLHAFESLKNMLVLVDVCDVCCRYVDILFLDIFCAYVLLFRLYLAK